MHSESIEELGGADPGNCSCLASSIGIRQFRNKRISTKYDIKRNWIDISRSFYRFRCETKSLIKKILTFRTYSITAFYSQTLVSRNAKKRAIENSS